MQLKLDFTNPRHDDGKKTDSVTIALSTELKEFLNLMSTKQGVSRSELTHRYIVEGIKNDVARIFMPEPHLDKSLRDVLAKF